MTEHADALMTLVKSGDMCAFAELLPLVEDNLMPWLQRVRGQSFEDAQDIAQEVGIRMLKHATSFTGRGVMTWARNIATNLVIDQYRKGSLDIITDNTEDGNLLSLFAGDDRDPADIVEQRDEYRYAVGLLDDLPDEQGYLMLAVAEGQSLPELAEEFDAPLPTIKSRMRLAREKIPAARERADNDRRLRRELLAVWE